MNELTIRLEPSDDGLPAEAVWLAIRAAQRGMEGVARVTSSAPGGLHVKVIRASMNSPYQLTMKGEDAARECALLFLRGARALEADAVMPPGFDAPTAKTVRALGELAGKHALGVLMTAPHEALVRITRQAATNVDKLLGPDRRPYGEWTTLRGVMDMATARQGGRFEVWDRVLNTFVACRMESSVTLPQVKEGLFSRVEISGPTKFDGAGIPLSMSVEKLRVLDKPNPVTLAELADFDFTGGVDHADFVLELRDDD